MDRFMSKNVAGAALSVEKNIGKAFTLIELLVVVAIAAGLVGILLPVLGSTRRHARSIQCLANQRSIVQASLMYTTDQREVLLGTFEWYFRIRDYVALLTKGTGNDYSNRDGMPSIYFCPEKRIAWPVLAGETNPATGLPVEYTNYALNGAEENGFLGSVAGVGPSYFGAFGGRTHLDWLKTPSATFATVDSMTQSRIVDREHVRIVGAAPGDPIRNLYSNGAGRWHFRSNTSFPHPDHGSVKTFIDGHAEIRKAQAADAVAFSLYPGGSWSVAEHWWGNMNGLAAAGFYPDRAFSSAQQDPDLWAYDQLY